MPLPEWFHEVARRVSNRGRWGADDEIGTINLITPDATRRGAACVKRGVSFSLALPLHHDGVQTGRIPNRVNPIHTMIGINTAFTGDRDGCMDTRLFDEVMRGADFPRGLKVRRIREAGHFVHQERPEELNPVLLEWLRRHDRGV